MAATKYQLGPVSAYAIAKAHGFEGTEEEWLESLHASTEQVGQWLRENPEVLQQMNPVKGTVATLAELPATGNELNDTYYVQSEKYRVTWTETQWVQSSMSEAEYSVELASVAEESRGNASGLANMFEYLFFNSDASMTFVRGTRGAAAGTSVDVATGGKLWACSSLIATEKDDIFTIINLMPDRYIFTVRGYTENEENSGTFVSAAGYFLNQDLSSSGKAYTQYSNAVEAVYQNTVAIGKTTASNCKYLSIHVRRPGNNNLSDGDLPKIQAAFKLLKVSPKLDANFLPEIPADKLPAITLDMLPTITSAKRTKAGDYCEWFNYGVINIDTENKTLSSSVPTSVLRCGTYRRNNPNMDFSNLDTSQHQTIYYDFSDGTIKVTGSVAYQSMEGNENTAVLGSTWPKNKPYPNGYYHFNAPMDVYVNGVKQLNLIDYNNNKTMGLFGDSICFGRTTSTGRTTYPLEDILNMELGISATNKAVGGSTYAARSSRPNDLSKLVVTNDMNYSFALFFSGTNDYGMNIPLGTIEDAPSGEDGNTFCAAVKFCIETALAKNPDIELGIVTPTFRNYVSNGGYGNTYTTVKNAAGATLGDYCDALVKIGELYNIPVYDMRKNSPINFINYASMLEEQAAGSGNYLHPKDATYAILNHKIAKWVEANF